MPILARARGVAGLLSSAMLLALSMTSETAVAEGFFDYRVGAAFTEHDDVEFRGAGVKLEESTDFDDSFTAGLRGGYWFELLPWVGLAADASYFHPDSSIYVVPISPLLMLRLPLVTSDQYPHGRLQPFVGAGPGIFVTLVDDHQTDFSDTTADVGVDVRAGLKLEVAPIMAIFAEYRYTSFEAHADDEVFGVPFDVDIPLDSHHVAIGFGFHF
jgi:hypothetical protein